jgi:MFS family permease
MSGRVGDGANGDNGELRVGGIEKGEIDLKGEVSMNPCRRELYYVIVLLLLSVSWGLATGYFGSAGNETFEESFGIPITGSATSLTTVFNLLAPMGGIVGGPLVNLVLPRLGRRASTFVVAVVAAVMWLLTGTMRYWNGNRLQARGFFAAVCLFRVCLGICVGGTSTLIPVYITELAPTQLRGVYAALHQFGISLGGALVYVLGLGISHWSTLAFISMIPAALQALLIWTVPDSPVQAQAESSESPFQFKYTTKFLTAIALCFFQQMGGTSAFVANMTNIFRQAVPGLNPRVMAMLSGVIGLTATVLASTFVGLWGRKVTWILSSAFQVVTLLMGSFQVLFKGPEGLFVAGMVLNTVAFGLGTAGIAWFFVCELFNDAVRAKATGIVTGVTWVMGTLVYYVWDGLQGAVGQGWGLFVFAVIMTLSTIFGFFLQEPTGKMGAEAEKLEGLVGEGDREGETGEQVVVLQ